MFAKNTKQKLIKSLNKLETIAEELNTSKLVDKTNLHKIIEGFKFLTSCLESTECSESRVFKLVIIWCRLYLKMQSYIDPKNESLSARYEKTTSKIITYMIGCLQCRVYDVNNYYFIILQIIDELLKNMQLTSMKKLAGFETGIISCLWYPIDNAGDFNTEILALKIIWKLLQICDIEKQKQELDAIECSTIHLIEPQLNEMIQKGNVDTFESMARKLLNIHNINLDSEIKVYSTSCQLLRFDKCIEFYKPLNSDKFWVDFNCGPRTLSFKGRYKSSLNENYELIQIIIKINAITAFHGALTVHYEDKIEFSKISTDLEILNNFNKVTLFLSDTEAKRLATNKYVYEHFNIKTMDCKNLMSIDARTSDEESDTKTKPILVAKNVSDKNNVLFDEKNNENNTLSSHIIQVPEMLTMHKKKEVDNNATNTVLMKSPKTPKLTDTNNNPKQELSNKRKFFKTSTPKTVRKSQNKKKACLTKPKEYKTPTEYIEPIETISLTDDDRKSKSPTAPSSRSLDLQTTNDCHRPLVVSSNLRKRFATALQVGQQRAASSNLSHPHSSAKRRANLYDVFDEI